jgi:adenylylsulfate kinase
MSTNVVWHEASVHREAWARQRGHRSAILWFTGLSGAGKSTLTAFVSPFRSDRDRARSIVAPGDFLEVHCAADLAICEQRDTKGLYARARAGEIPHFTGISSPYEAPVNPELRVNTGSLPINDCVQQVIDHLESLGILGRPDQAECPSP